MSEPVINNPTADGESKLHKIVTGTFGVDDLQTLVVPKVVAVAALSGGVPELSDPAADTSPSLRDLALRDLALRDLALKDLADSANNLDLSA